MVWDLLGSHIVEKLHVDNEVIVVDDESAGDIKHSRHLSKDNIKLYLIKQSKQNSIKYLRMLIMLFIKEMTTLPSIPNKRSWIPPG